jgi:hypothetical protein
MDSFGNKAMRRWLVILGLVVALLAGVGLGVLSVYALIPKAVLPLPRLPDTAPWYPGLDIQKLADKASEANGRARGDPGHGAIGGNGHVHYTKSWTGPTDPKKVMDYLDGELRTFVSSKGGTKYSELQPQGAGAEFGWQLYWEFKVEGWRGWFNAWIVSGADNRFTLVIVMHAVEARW